MIILQRYPDNSKVHYWCQYTEKRCTSTIWCKWPC